MADNSQLNTPGEILATARRKAGFSLEELAVRTKIQPDMLLAIERDEYHKISGDLYVKSFMGSYAREVNVEPELVVGMYKDFSGAGAEGNFGSSDNQWDEEDVEVSSVGLPWVKLFIIAVAIAGLAGAFFFFVLRGNEDGNVVSQENPSPPNINAEADVPEDKSVQKVLAQPESNTTAVPVAGPDTLGLGWQKSAPIAKDIVISEETPEPQAVSSFTTVEDSASRILATTGRGHLPPAFPGTCHTKQGLVT